MNVRSVKEADIPTLQKWYNWYITNGTETFETAELSEEAFCERVQRILQEYPYLVLEDHGQLCGYAYLDHFNPRAAYDWTADLSIYLDPEQRGKGYGSALMDAILHEAEEGGWRNVVSIITDTNTASEAFHRKYGFVKVGALAHVGWKFDQWLGVTYYMKTIDASDQRPRGLRKNSE